MQENATNLSKEYRISEENDRVIKMFKVVNDLVQNQLQIRSLGRFNAQHSRPRPIKIAFNDNKFIHWCKKCQKFEKH